MEKQNPLYKGNVGYRLKRNELIINSLKSRFKFHKSKDHRGIIRTLTIKRDALDDYYIFISCLTNQKNSQTINSTTDKIAGFDFGLKSFLIGSEKDEFEKIKNPEYLKQSIKHLKKASKAHSKKKKGSNNRERSRKNLARLHKRLSNLRGDFQWKLAHKITDKYDVVCFEDLTLKGMQGLWGRKVSDYAFNDFLNRIEWIVKKKGKQIIKIDRFYPSSKTCSVCGWIDQNLTLSAREWTCSDCRSDHNRDKNAAINIKMVGASTVNGAPVRPVFDRQGAFAH